MADTKNIVSRRGFIGACGAAAATLAIPACVEGKIPAAGARSWAETLESWEAAVRGAHVPAFRAAYVAEVERFAETLRPRFASGELRGFTDDDLEREGEDRDWKAPCWVLSDLCAAHFKIEDMDPVTVRLLIEASPHGEVTSGHADNDRGWLRDACCWDVLAVAQARGMYVPAAGEDPDPLAEEWCACGHRAAWHSPGVRRSPSGCPCVGCDCAEVRVVGVGAEGARAAEDAGFARYMSKTSSEVA